MNGDEVNADYTIEYKSQTVRRSADIKELAIALTKAQAQIKSVSKDAFNPHFGSKYADLSSVLEAIKEPFAANGLCLTQHPTSRNGEVVVTSILLHISGQFLESDLPMIPDKKTPQGFGSAITYARRYAAMAIAGLAPDDDDGNAASAPKEKPAQKRDVAAPQKIQTEWQNAVKAFAALGKKETDLIMYLKKNKEAVDQADFERLGTWYDELQREKDV